MAVNATPGRGLGWASAQDGSQLLLHCCTDVIGHTLSCACCYRQCHLVRHNRQCSNAHAISFLGLDAEGVCHPANLAQHDVPVDIKASGELLH